MKYEIFTAQYLSELEDIVNKRLKEGWKCQGGVSIAGFVNDYGRFEQVYAQAMVKKCD